LDISSKQKMLQELLQHNVEGGFINREDWFPPKKITSFKPHHPDEQNPRMVLPVRKHFDAFWQINLALGCKYLQKLAKSAANPEVFALTGELDNSNSALYLNLLLILFNTLSVSTLIILSLTSRSSICSTS
jgi:hypothetical protein